VFLHDTQKLDHNFAGWSDQYLALSASLGDDYRVEALTQNIHTHHCWFGMCNKTESVKDGNNNF
jgi:hypothetical protein